MFGSHTALDIILTDKQIYVIMIREINYMTRYFKIAIL